MAVRIRMKKMGRKHRPFFRICAIDRKSPRDGRVIEELGYYDPMVKEKDARAVLKSERIDYWLGVGAQPSHKCSVLIRKYGTNGTHLEAQQAAFDRLSIKPQAPEPVVIALPSDEPAEAAAEEAAAPEAEAAPAEPAAPAGEAAEAEAGGGEAAAESGEEKSD